MSKTEDELIYDRTITDVTKNIAKGNYNASDLNRVEEWIKYLSETLNGYGYYTNLEVKTDWDKYDLKNMQSNIDRIRNNLIALKNVFYVLSTTPVDSIIVNKTSINYIEANALEKTINDIDYLINSMKSYFVHCGVGTMGSNLTWQNRFRRY